MTVMQRMKQWHHCTPDATDSLLVSLVHLDIVHVALPVFDVASMVCSHHPEVIVAPTHCSHRRIMRLQNIGVKILFKKLGKKGQKHFFLAEQFNWLTPVQDCNWCTFLAVGPATGLLLSVLAALLDAGFLSWLLSLSLPSVLAALSSVCLGCCLPVCLGCSLSSVCLGCSLSCLSWFLARLFAIDSMDLTRLLQKATGLNRLDSVEVPWELIDWLSYT